MKTKISLAVTSALFAIFAFVSCTPEVKEAGFNPPSGIYDGYAITFSSNVSETGGGGYVYAYTIENEQEVAIRRSHAGETVYIKVEPYKGYTFTEWSAPGANIDNITLPTTSFVMPDRDINIGVLFNGSLLTPQTLIESIEEHKNLPENVKLRQWKARQTQQAFVWFDAWSGRMETGASSVRALPKEVTIASNWGQPKWGLSDWQKADLQYMREVYGTKFVVTLFSAAVGDDVETDPDWSKVGSSSNDALIRPIIAKYAKRLYEKCLEEGYDGYDWDFEPAGGGEAGSLWRVAAQAGCFLEELSYYFGTKAQEYTLQERKANGIDRGAVPTKRLLLLVDGEVHSSYFKGGVNNTVATAYVDYYVNQAYSTFSESGNRGRVNGILTQLRDHINNGLFTEEEATGRCILAENFESNASSGGGLLVMAGLTHSNGFKTGGFGIYRVGMDYELAVLNNKPDYRGSKYWYWLRQAIDDQYGTGARE